VFVLAEDNASPPQRRRLADSKTGIQAKQREDITRRTFDPCLLDKSLKLSGVLDRANVSPVLRLGSIAFPSTATLLLAELLHWPMSLINKLQVTCIRHNLSNHVEIMSLRSGGERSPSAGSPDIRVPPLPQHPRRDGVQAVVPQSLENQ
jgi:hypothetical protein